MKSGKLFLTMIAIMVMIVIAMTCVACGESTITDDEMHAAYRLYQEEGGTLSYELWLASIKGEKGDKGDKGEKGEKGDKGADGVTPTIEINSDGYWVINGTVTNVKAEGQQGAQGEQGIQGEKGETGAKGDKGDTGAKGDKGDTGAKGDQGIQGPKGDKGDTGAQGEQGIQGEKGSQGEKGDTGAKGDKGDTGTKGDTGAKGDKGDNGLTPYVGDNGNWWIGEEDTGITGYNDILFSVSFGNGFRWTLTKYGKLTISGTGIIPSTPWLSFKDLIAEVVIEEGITVIPDGAFDDYRNIRKVYFPSTLVSIGERAFATGTPGTPFLKMTDYYYTGTIQSWLAVEKKDEWTLMYNLYLNGELLTDLVLPDSFDLPEDAFSMCFSLRNVVLPSTMTVVPRNVFACCINLQTVVLPEGLRTIASGAFGESGVVSLTLPSTLEAIESEPGAFTGCYRLSEIYNKSTLDITLGSYDNGGVAYFAKAIYTEPYESKISVDEEGYILYIDGEDVILLGYTGEETELTLPDGITEINGGAFMYNQTIKSVTIPQGVTRIGEGAFAGCSSLTGVTIPEGVTSIGNSVFCECTSLTSITIPEGVTSIGSAAFCVSGLRSVIIPDSVTNLGDHAFYDCPSLASVTIGDGVTTIGYMAFGSCESLTSVTIGRGVTSIGDSTFAVDGEGGNNISTIFYTGDYAGWCAIAGLKELMNNRNWISRSLYIGGSLVEGEVVIPEGVTTIGDYAFFGRRLTSVTLPNTLTSIGYSAFYGCTSLTSVHYTGDIASWCSITFHSNPLSFSDSYSNFYINDELITDLVIPDGVTVINDFAFCGATCLTSIRIHDSVTSIGNYAFCECTSLTSVTIPDSVTSIGNSAFEDCTSLTSVTIPDSVTSMGWAFYDCGALETVYYGGTEADRESKGLSGDYRYNYATWYYYSETEPEGDGNYWHYDTDGETILVW